MSVNKYVGLGIYGLLTWFASKGSSSSEDQSDSEPDDLSVTETDTGTPIPVVIGRAMIKNPLVIYFGDFRADRYTETYAAHANFSAWPIILSALIAWLGLPTTGNSVTATPHGHGAYAPPPGMHSHTIKESAGPNYLMMLAQWLLSWLINGRNLKTTMQKGFKYYLGYQMLCCYSGKNMRVRSIHFAKTKVWEGDARQTDSAPTIACLGDSITAGYPYAYNTPSPSADVYSWTNAIRKSLKGTTVYNCGMSGTTLEHMLYRFDSQIVPLKPQYVIVMGGVNDINNGETPDVALSFLDRIIKKCKSNSFIPVVGIYPTMDACALFTQQKKDDINILRQKIIDYCLSEKLHMIDFRPAVLKADGTVDSGKYTFSVGGATTDYCHPNDAGYKAMGDCVLKVLGAIGIGGIGPYTISINNEELFGGVDENGGFVGDVRVYLGSDNQTADSWMQSQMNAASVQADLKGLTPAYRPYVSLVVPTAYIGKSSTIPETWIELQDQPDALGLGGIGEDANPAEAIYYLHTNDRWGLGESEDLLDLDSLRAVGKTLKDEGVGLTIVIKEITDAKTLINAILEHINGVKYVEPSTGKLVFKLIRDDYEPAAVPVMDTGNLSALTMTRLDWRETVGSVSVTYTDRAAVYEQSSLEDNDPAVIDIAQNKTAKTYSYLYFTTAANALWAAKRECQEQGYPLASFSITGNRTLSDLRIGDVARLNWKPLGISNMYVRITDIDLGDFVNGEIRIDAVEDVFSLSKTDFDFSGSTNWNPETVSPTGVQNYRFMEMPWEIMPEKNSYVYALAAQPDAFTQKWTVWRNTPATGWNSTNSLTNWTPAGRLVYDYSEEGDAIDATGFTVVGLGNLDILQSASLTTGAPDLTSARQGGKYLVVNDEIMAWSKLEELSNGHWAVSGLIRGVMDTVPKTHHGGDIVYFIDSPRMANVTTGGPVCSQGQTVTESYNITTATVYAEETFDYLKAKTLTTESRSMRPNPPGKIRMSDRNETDERFISTVCGDLSISFVPRNKERSFGAVSQDDIQDYWSGLAIEKPAGMTFILRVLSGINVLGEYEVSDSPFSLPWSVRGSLGGELLNNTILRIYAKQDGLLSTQYHERNFEWKIPSVVDVCTDATQVAARMTTWAASDRINIPQGTLNISPSQVMFSEYPVFVLGTVSTAGNVGAIRSYDGSYIVPDGSAVIVKPGGTTDTITLDEGFVFSSPYVPQASGGVVYYKMTSGVAVQIQA